MPARTRNSVVLPAPFSPMTAMRSPDQSDPVTIAQFKIDASKRMNEHGLLMLTEFAAERLIDLELQRSAGRMDDRIGDIDLLQADAGHAIKSNRSGCADSG